MKEKELYGFIGVNLLISYHKLQSWLNNWKYDEDLSIPFVSCVMSRIRFHQILWNLHVSDDSEIPAESKDKLYKSRPLITRSKQKWYNTL